MGSLPRNTTCREIRPQLKKVDIVAFCGLRGCLDIERFDSTENLWLKIGIGNFHGAEFNLPGFLDMMPISPTSKLTTAAETSIMVEITLITGFGFL